MNENHIVLEFEGYPTFNDVEDYMLRFRNRGSVLVNIVEDQTAIKATREQVWAKVESYLRTLPMEELPHTMAAFQVACAMRQIHPISLN